MHPNVPYFKNFLGRAYPIPRRSEIALRYSPHDNASDPKYLKQ